MAQCEGIRARSVAPLVKAGLRDDAFEIWAGRYQVWLEATPLF
jgi:hypothetical protein